MDEIRLSKLLSLVLRHDPRRIGIALDSAGWVSIGDLVDALNRSGFAVSRTQIESIVEKSGKQRFAIDTHGDFKVVP